MEKKAIALKYPEGFTAPVVTAKGKGPAAERIIELAKENEIYIKEDTELINLLSLCQEGDLVMEEAWEALAVIFAFILKEGD